MKKLLMYFGRLFIFVRNKLMISVALQRANENATHNKSKHRHPFITPNKSPQWLMLKACCKNKYLFAFLIAGAVQQTMMTMRGEIAEQMETMQFLTNKQYEAQFRSCGENKKKK